MIENDCDDTTFQCRCAQERFAHAHHVKGDQFLRSCSLDTNLMVVKTGLVSTRLFNLFAGVAFTDFCDLGFCLVRAFAFALRLVLLLVPTASSFVSVFSTIWTLTIEARVFCCRFSVTLASVAIFSFLATFLAVAGFSLAFPFPREGIDFHRIIFVSVSS